MATKFNVGSLRYLSDLVLGSLVCYSGTSRDNELQALHLHD